ncbi:hypothetical protein RF11_03091 [Thelohanellus kitauei]|uniref:Uncharacterized protein n=1 Tax=Thelohanellus kitauei TaxID=669202 RepID=A0A0C2INZ4_THEKT|nr:hypothetical protein RF11_03091 [Thelohanellus kitauei]
MFLNKSDTVNTNEYSSVICNSARIYVLPAKFNQTVIYQRNDVSYKAKSWRNIINYRFINKYMLHGTDTILESLYDLSNLSTINLNLCSSGIIIQIGVSNFASYA